MKTAQEPTVKRRRWLPGYAVFLGVAFLGALLLLAACGSPAASPLPTATPPIQFSGLFSMTIDTAKTYVATLKTAKGNVVVELNAVKAPQTVNNFVNLARKGYYNNTTFHRVLPNFMAQGGDPTGTGAGGPGYTIPDEFTDLTHNKGVISMANTGQPNSGSSQFFITTVPTPWLDGKHAVFGKVISGMNVVESLTSRDPNQNPGYAGDRLIEVTIEER